jgi:hypothetical protein
MVPAFRRSWVLQCFRPPRNGRFSATAFMPCLRIGRALVSSTIVVSPGNHVLRKFFHGATIPYDQDVSPEENLESAIASIHAHLSRRTARRLGVPSNSIMQKNFALRPLDKSTP